MNFYETFLYEKSKKTNNIMTPITTIIVAFAIFISTMMWSIHKRSKSRNVSTKQKSAPGQKSRPYFCVPCYISKNNPTLRKRLEDLGYVKHPSCLVDKTDKSFLFCNRGMYAEIPFGYEEEYKHAIDCGNEDDLFLAIAAIRYDSDIEQWFCDDAPIESRSYFLCHYDRVADHIRNEMDGWDCEGFHAASLKDLFELFESRRNKKIKTHI